MKNIEELSLFLCENFECERCPVFTEKADTRTEYERCVLHYPCVGELYKWIIYQSEKEVKILNGAV